MAEKFLRGVMRGIRVDRKRFGSDVTLFDEKKASTRPVEAPLDFFHQSQEIEPKKTAESLPENKSDNSDSDLDDEVETKSTTEEEHDAKKQNDNESEEDGKMNVRNFRKQHGIHVQGSDIPAPISDFLQLETRFNIPNYMVKNLTGPAPSCCGYTEPTPIQMQAIPIMIQGRDLMACAPTGSGKTIAFAIPILAALKGPGKVGLRAVVLSPTRELASQIHRHFETLGNGRKFKIFLLTKANANENTFGKEVLRRDVLVATPLMLVHLVQKGHVDLSHVEHLVMDEADRLFQEGFLEQVDEIFAACTHAQLRRTMFSATMVHICIY
jgi:ATP-dependent RNA helicase DDX52/ROK1